MPSLKCPQCGQADLHAIDVESLQPEIGSKGGVKRSHARELGCKRCGWSPSKAHEPDLVLASTPLDHNV